MRRDFGVAVGAVGSLLAVGVAGTVSSSVVTGFALARLGVGWLLAGSTALAASRCPDTRLAPRPARSWSCCAAARPGLGSDRRGTQRVRRRPLRRPAHELAARQLRVRGDDRAAGDDRGARRRPRVAVGVRARRGGAGGAGDRVRGRRHGAWAATRPVATGRRPRPCRGRGAKRDTLRRCRRCGSARSRSRRLRAIEVAAGLWAYTLLTEGRGSPPAWPARACRRTGAACSSGGCCTASSPTGCRSGAALVACIGGMGAGAVLVAVPGPGAGWPWSA